MKPRAPRRPVPLGRDKPLGKVFAEARRAWGGNGPGSSSEKTKVVFANLTAFLRRCRIDRLVDLGCGTFGWLEPLTAELVSYVGYDVVPEVVEQNRAAYPKLRFELYTGGPIEECDAVLCRDVMQHLTSRQNLHLIAVAQKARWLIATTQGCSNRELTATGGFRPVNLKRHPYRLGTPIAQLRDYGQKYLGCWDLRRATSPTRPAGSDSAR